MPRLYNKRKSYIPEEAVYIGRPSKWGNPYVVSRDGSRKEVIKKYRNYLLNNESLLCCLGELRGKDLACWCSPLPCHGEVLIELANKESKDK